MLPIATNDTERAVWIALRDAHDALVIVLHGTSADLVDAVAFQETIAKAALRSVQDALNLQCRDAAMSYMGDDPTDEASTIH